jgi:hypothetical protein
VPGKCAALSSNPSTADREREREKERKREIIILVRTLVICRQLGYKIGRTPKTLRSKRC